MSLVKVPVGWQTGIGGTGVSIFYAAFGSDITVELAAFFNSVKAQFVSAVSWDIPGSGDVIDELTGKITGAWIGGTPATITGTAAGSYAGGTGAYVRWQTAGIVDGRRVKGRTFLAPLTVNAYDSVGTIATTTLTALQGAATTLATTGKLRIWHRPGDKAGDPGSIHIVTAGVVPDKVTSLRTRRV